MGSYNWQMKVCIHISLLKPEKIDILYHKGSSISNMERGGGTNIKVNKQKYANLRGAN